ncbi:MAG: GtrA family protein [Rhodomicrobium sp.]
MQPLRTLVSIEAVRFGINGLTATAAHYAVLRTCLEAFHFSSAGLASFVAALFGISVSFAGSRWFVFRHGSKPVLDQATRFIVLYGLLACMHALLLFLWTDLWGLDYTAGFAVAVAIQATASYTGNKHLVFST